MANPFLPPRTGSQVAGDVLTGIAGGPRAVTERRALRAEQAALAQEQAASQSLTEARELVFSGFQQELLGGSTPQQAFVNLYKRGVISEAVAIDPTILDDLEQTIAQMTPKGPQFQALSPGQIPGVTDPVTGEFKPTGPAAPFAPTAPAVQVMPGDTRRQQLEAERAVAQLPEEIRGLEAQISNTEAMLSLLESGVQTGKWPAAVVDFVKNRFGVDIGQDPKLEAFNSIAASETLTALGSIRGNPTEGERQFVQQLTALSARGPESNKAVLAVRKAVLERQVAERREEKAYYERNGGTLRGFDDYIQDWAAKQGPVIPQSTIASVTNNLARAQQQEAQSASNLAEALSAGDASAVNQALIQMGQDAVNKLPKAVRDAARRILEGGKAEDAAPKPPLAR